MNNNADKLFSSEEFYDYIIRIGKFKQCFLGILDLLQKISATLNQCNNDAINQLKNNLIVSPFNVDINQIFQDLMEEPEFEQWESIYKGINELYQKIKMSNKFRELHDQIQSNLLNQLQHDIPKYSELTNLSRPEMVDVEKAGKVIIDYIVTNKKISNLISYADSISTANPRRNQPTQTLIMSGFSNANFNLQELNLNSMLSQAKNLEKSVELGKYIQNDWKSYAAETIPKLKPLYELYETEQSLLKTLAKFDPEFQVFLPRLSEIINKDQEFTERALKFTLSKYPELGTYNELAQVFKPVDSIMNQIDELLNKYYDNEKQKSGKI
ncbi:MAG: hypothetical protein INQ03_21260 [Candidatus Heimdallarchaeota archaeon]|nr:hypothetical protein [Candidatus Heimdallarchaeota archaeon]